jgi:predicted transcriptional regulator
MEIIWDKGEASVIDVAEILNRDRKVAKNTVRTLMDRMRGKGWLGYKPVGRTYVYSALVPQDESLGQRVVEMVDKACGGEPEKLMMALLNYRGLSDEEAERIQKMLNEAKANRE